MPARHAAALPDSGAEDYDRLAPAVWNPVSNAVVAAADVLVGERVLDVFAATGSGTIPAAQLAGPSGHVDAVDRSSAMLDLAEAKAEALGLGNVSFHRSDPARWVPDAAYDAAVSCYGVLLLEEMDAGMDHIVRMLRPGGRIAISVWDEGALDAFEGLLLDSIAAGRDGGESGSDRIDAPVVGNRARLASSDRLRDWLQARGLTDVAVEKLGLTVPLEPGHAWSFALGSGYRRLLPGSADALQRVRRAFEERLGEDFVLDAGSLIAVGHHQPDS
ncbi:methyltransferase domain-containing protein [Arthrobacter sp. NamB2]|uniref:class I SAM-dependent methyltransferase n=1 Tax=Arthrobacter sp. NamB2 TaxID=2576035 RepID=UPI0010C99A52|nr:methyltransferase domain-containing protein [Arthrobacter sp. NamB2]TKV29674.1 methyltransferase domain-containing protein [Arthrobacter sp. NamB2]